MRVDFDKSARAFDPLALTVTAREDAMTAAFKVLDSVQDDALPQATSGIAIAFAEFCRKLRLDPQAVHALGAKMARDERFHHHANCQSWALDEWLSRKAQGRI